MAVLAAVLLAPACGALPGTAGKLKVVATFSILGDITRNVGGEAIDLTVLASAGLDPHTYQPSPADLAKVAEADVVIENGLHFEGWLDGIIESSESLATRAAVGEAVSPLRNAPHADEEPADDHGHGEVDPHVWHSVANTIQMTKAIRDALAQADPANAATYHANAEAYIGQLQALDKWVFEQVGTLPEARRKLVTAHDTFGYFADRYGFEVIGTLLPTTTEGAMPSAQHLARLVDGVRAAGVPAIFAENVSANGAINQIASEAGVAVVASLYTDALGSAGSGADTYIGLMRHNVQTIVGELNK